MSLLLSGCGQVFVGFASNPQIAPSTVSGMITIVHLGFATGDGGVEVTFTVVTFVNGGLSNTLDFCGDQRSQFPINQSVKVNFTPGNICSTLVTVVVI
jgi:hypothetical protein